MTTGPDRRSSSARSVVGNWEREIARFRTASARARPPRSRPDPGRPGHHRSGRVRRRRHDLRHHRPRQGGTRGDRVGTRRRRRGPTRQERLHRGPREPSAPYAPRHRVALTGTPVENRLEDLRAVVDLVNPGLLGSPSVFKARFAEAIERERDPDAVRRLAAVTSPFILRRVKTDLRGRRGPARQTELTVRANLTSPSSRRRCTAQSPTTSWAALGKVESDATHEGHRVRTVLAALTRLKQCATTPPTSSVTGRRCCAATHIARASSSSSPTSSTRSSPTANALCCSPSSPPSARCSPRGWPPGSTLRSRSCTAGWGGRHATRWSSSSPRPTVRP